jgi:hypothetical protein
LLEVGAGQFCFGPDGCATQAFDKTRQERDHAERQGGSPFWIRPSPPATASRPA